MEAGTSTLADNLLDDLDDLSDLDDEEKSPPQLHQHQETPPGEDGESSLLVASTGTNQPRLLAEAPLQSHVVTIGSWKSSSSNEDAAREYQLIVHSNKWLTKLSDELAAIHVALRQVYHVKFPELADLLPDARQYQQAVQTIRNETDLTRVNQALNEFLTANQVITLTVSASTTGGRTLTEEELSACDTWTAYMRQIEETQQLLMDFVAGCMHNLAPAVCALTGPALAARLIGLAGGLVELSVIPACNIEILGQTKQTSSSRAGFGSQAGQPHQGILVRTALVQSVAQSERRKVLKWVAAKVALAARCDATAVQQGRPRSGKPGEQFYEALRKKVQHLQAPDQAPVLKALPKPDLTVKKRRGGKRMRRLKERFEETALMKQANTRAFSSQAGEYGDDAMGLSRGLLDTDDVAGGNLRRTTEKRKVRQANTKASRKKAAHMEAHAKRQSQSNGLASTISFTPLQGMELVNPDAQKDRVKKANQKWFAESAGFQSALPKRF